MRFVSWKVESESGRVLVAPEVVDQEFVVDWERETGKREERRAEDEEDEEELRLFVSESAEAEAEALMVEEEDVALMEAEGEGDAVADSVATKVENFDWTEEEDDALELDATAEEA